MVRDRCALLKRSTMELVTFANRKIAKRNEVELVLLTDLFLYGKPSADRKGLYTPPSTPH